jgi:UDP-N-acetylmuramate--alanine ligase
MAEYRHIYFIGIGGIGMSAIARYYNAKGFKVSGYDKTPSPLTHALEAEGIEVHYEDNIDFVPKDPETTLVVYTPAVPKDMGELTYVQKNGYRVIKRSRMLGEISAGQRCMAVAGTHGKTTTSTLVSHIFTASGEGCSAFLGGISKNYGTNLLIHSNDVVVAEADEFDRSFLQLFPEIAVITSMDPDHLDIYGDEAHIREAFKAFASQVSGTVIAKHGLDITPADTKARILTYSYDDPEADFHAVLTDGDGTGFTHFDLYHPGGVISDCVVGIPGWVNIENAVGAAAIGLTYGLDPEKIREALASFSGVKRRFDIQLKSDRCIYIDDYAHHPREISASLTSIRGNFPDYRMTAIFQPHLYTRTRDLYEEFAEALNEADEVVLLPIYPARELPIEGITTEIIANLVTKPCRIVEREALAATIGEMDTDVVVSFGAGNIDSCCESLAEIISKKAKG